MVAIKVELAPTNGALDPSPTWVDISQYVSLSAGITCNRGRGRTATTPEPGRLTLTLNNDDGRFTWGNPDGAYGLGLGENAQLRQPIRVTALVGEYDSDVIAYDAAFDYDGYTEIPLWTGYVDEWVGTWDNGYRPRVRVTASDRLARLALLNLDDGAIRSEILYDSPVAYFPLVDAAGSTAGGTFRGDLLARVVDIQTVTTSALDFGSGTGPDGNGTVATFTREAITNGYALRADTAPGFLAASASDGGTVEAWILVAASSDDNQGILSLVSTPSNLDAPRLGLTLNDSGYAVARSYDNDIFATTRATATGSTDLADGQWHHIVATIEVIAGNCTIKLYEDGVHTATSSDTWLGPAGGWYESTMSGIIIGKARGTASPVGGLPVVFDGQMAHVAVYDTALSADRILQHYSAGKSAGSFYGESASDRFTRLCRLSGLPAAAYATDATATTLVGAQNLGGVGMLDAIQQVTDSERGVVIVNGAGVLTYLSAQSIANLTSDVTLAATDINGSVGLTTNDLELTNDVTVVRAGGATQRRADDVSIAQIGSNAVTVETLLTTDAEAGALADLLLAQGLVIQPRTDDLTLDLAAKWRTIDIATVCALDTGSRATVTGLPVGSPSATIDVLVQGVAHDIAASKWDLTLTVTPALTLPAWELDDATLSGLGSTTRLGY